MGPDEIARWKQQPLCTPRELEQYCCGLPPGGIDRSPWSEQLDFAEMLIRRAIINSDLETIPNPDGSALYGTDCYLNTNKAIDWADELFPTAGKPPTKNQSSSDYLVQPEQWPLWTLEELVQWCSVIENHAKKLVPGRPNDAAMNSARESIRRAILIGDLHVVRESYITPTEAIPWAARVFPKTFPFKAESVPHKVDPRRVAAAPSLHKEEPQAATGKKWEIEGSWEQQARAIGQTWMMAEEQRTQERPGVEAIAKHVEGELSNLGITGKRGKFPDWETIKREALTGITERKAKGRK